MNTLYGFYFQHSHLYKIKLSVPVFSHKDTMYLHFFYKNLEKDICNLLLHMKVLN